MARRAGSALRIHAVRNPIELAQVELAGFDDVIGCRSHRRHVCSGDRCYCSLLEGSSGFTRRHCFWQKPLSGAKQEGAWAIQEASVSSKIVLWWRCSYNGCVALVSLGDVLGLVAEGACGPRAYLVHLGAQSIVIVWLAVHGAPVASNDCQQREQHHEWPDSAGWHMSARHRRCASSDEDPMLCDCGPICVWGWGGVGGRLGEVTEARAARAYRSYSNSWTSPPHPTGHRRVGTCHVGWAVGGGNGRRLPP